MKSYVAYIDHLYLKHSHQSGSILVLCIVFSWLDFNELTQVPTDALKDLKNLEFL